MNKYNVHLEFTKYVEDIEAEDEEDAIKQALIFVTNNTNDFFTAEDEIANMILDEFNNYSEAEEDEVE